jgi:hypothetical protein
MIIEDFLLRPAGSVAQDLYYIIYQPTRVFHYPAYASGSTRHRSETPPASEDTASAVYPLKSCLETSAFRRKYQRLSRIEQSRSPNSRRHKFPCVSPLRGTKGSRRN